jgi:ribosomal protein S18 acetylase RimI-like enzyme
LDDKVLLGRNLRGLAALHRLVGRYAGTVFEFDCATGSIALTAPDYPWLNAFVSEPGGSLSRVLEHVVEIPELVHLGVWACGPEQAELAVKAGFTHLIARVPAMGMELEYSASQAGASEPIALADAGALSDMAYGNRSRQLERTLARIPAKRLGALGRLDAGGGVIAAAVPLDVGGDCSVQYVATRSDAQRLGHGAALLADALAQARLRGCTTTSLQSSDAGLRLYRSLGYRTVGRLELRHRPG